MTEDLTKIEQDAIKIFSELSKRDGASNLWINILLYYEHGKSVKELYYF